MVKRIRARNTPVGQEQSAARGRQDWDENAASAVDYHRGARGRQYLCYTCNSRPCADDCTEQWEPDTLKRKAARATLRIEQWAAAHPDWIGWTLHAEREDVATFLASQGAGDGRQATEEDSSLLPAPGPRPPGERRIPVGAAMEQAMAVMAGRAQAEEVVPPYAESVP